MTNPLDEQITGLISTVNTIAEKTRELADNQAGQISSIHSTLRRMTALTVVLFILLLGTSFLGYRSYSSANEIRKNQKQITNIQKGALCPLYDSILLGYDPSSPTALKNPTLYSQRYTNFENGAKILHCAHTTRGPN